MISSHYNRCATAFPHHCLCLLSWFQCLPPVCSDAFLRREAVLCYSHIDGSYNQAEKSLHPKDWQQIANVQYINSQIITKLQIFTEHLLSICDRPALLCNLWAHQHGCWSGPSSWPCQHKTRSIMACYRWNMLYLKKKVVDLQTYIPRCCFSSCAENKICNIADEECGEKIREEHQ